MSDTDHSDIHPVDTLTVQAFFLLAFAFAMYSACLGDSFAESPGSSVLYSFAMAPAGSATTSSYVIGAKRFRYISCGLVEFCLKALLNPAYVVLVVAYIVIVIEERDEPPASLLHQADCA